MLSRRSMLAGITGAGMAGTSLAGPAGAQAVLTDDGLYTQPWFIESFLELADDLDAAAGRARRFAIMWDLKGCPYCKTTHLVNFARPDIASYVRERFDILQLNIIGAREVTDFDGQKLPEKGFAEKYGIGATPTFQFFPEQAAGLGAKAPKAREVARQQGYVPPDAFRRMFVFVAERAYEKGTLDDFMRA